MRLRDFIRQNREILDHYIRAANPTGSERLNDKERAEWVLNDEPLYLWAKSAGVPI